MKTLRAYLACFAALFSTASAIAEVRDYQSCILLSERNPARAVEQASDWRDYGGAGPANHCLALALIANDQPGRGAEILEELAAGTEGAVAVDLFTQAGNGWLLADRPGQAHSAFSKALAFADLSAEQELPLRLDRGRAAATLQEYPGALADLTRALELQSGNGAALLFRATVYRLSGDLAAAQMDIAAAQDALPNDPDVLFELGNIASLKEDFEAARTAWEQVRKRAPNTPVADAAKVNLENLAKLVAERAAIASE